MKDSAKATALVVKTRDFFKTFFLFNFKSRLTFQAEGNPVGIKACLESFGLCTAVVRPPLLEATKAVKDKLNILNK